MKVLMVCHGNICRSPLAQGILEQKVKSLGLDWVVDSAGTYAGHAGKPPDFRTQHVALAHGLDVSRQTARKFRFQDLDDFDLIYCMDALNYKEVLDMCDTDEERSRVRLIMNEVEPGKNLSIPDPYYGSEEGFEHAYQLIDKACDGVIRNHRK